LTIAHTLQEPLCKRSDGKKDNSPRDGGATNSQVVFKQAKIRLLGNKVPERSRDKSTVACCWTRSSLKIGSQTFSRPPLALPSSDNVSLDNGIEENRAVLFLRNLEYYRRCKSEHEEFSRELSKCYLTTFFPQKTRVERAHSFFLLSVNSSDFVRMDNSAVVANNKTSNK
jgi:hypothetical protein